MNIRRLWHAALPAMGMPLIFIGTWLLLEGMRFALWQVVSRAIAVDPQAAAPHVRELQVFVLKCSEMCIGVIAVVCGFLKLALHHPLVDARKCGYAIWLRSVPWYHDKPLPLGPVHLVWHEVAALSGIAVLMSFRFGVPPALVPIAYLAAYCVMTTAVAAQTGQGLVAFSLLFGFGALVRLWPAEWLMLCVAGILYGIASIGLRRSLQKLPLQNLPDHLVALRRPSGERSSESTTARSQSDEVGWPFSAIRPNLGKPLAPISALAAGILLGLLLAWWIYVVCFQITQSDPRAATSFPNIAMGAGVFFAAARLFAWVIGCMPPISAFGRLRTGHFVIPSYDCVLVAPACTIIASIAIFDLLRGSGFAPEVVLAVSVGASLLLAIALPPSRQRWRLTAPARLCR